MINKNNLKLNKIIDEIINESNFSREQVEHSIETFFRFIKQSIKSNIDEIYIPKFGKLIKSKKNKTK